MDWIQKLHEAVVRGRLNEIATLAKEAVASGMVARGLVDEAMIPAMNRVGELWRQEEYFLPEVLRSANTMKLGMEALAPYLVSVEYGKSIQVAIGTVKGDAHDIGKNLVAIMLKSAGYQVENLGVDVAPERFLEAAEKGARVIGLSSMLTTTIAQMESVIARFDKSGLRKEVTLIVGGAPVTREFAAKIGADHYGRDAVEGVEILNRLFG